MSTEPIFFNPVFKERIWGGAALRDFHYNIPSERTGVLGLRRSSKWTEHSSKRHV